MHRHRIFRLIAVSAVILFAGYLSVFNFSLPKMPAFVAGQSGSAPLIGGPFELTSHSGNVVDNAYLRGKPYLAFFGFTHCPEICPTTLFELTDLLKEPGSTSDKINVIFITVDPERDNQELLKLYMESFDPGIMALSGTQQQTETAVRAFAAYFRKVPMGESYTMDHTAVVYLMRADGTFAGTLDMHEPKDVRLKKIRNLVDAAS